jgi:hypothetical protein
MIGAKGQRFSLASEGAEGVVSISARLDVMADDRR